MKRDKVIGLAQTGKPYQQTDLFIYLIKFPEFGFYLIRVICGNRLKDFKIVLLKPVIDLQQAYTIGISAKSA